MNYYDARQVKDGGWRYSCRNDDKTWTVGYCTDHDAHPTKDEAYECYTRYLLDERLELDGTYADVRRRCQAPDCEEWTDRFAQVDNLRMWSLCDQHRSKDVVADLFGTVGASASSW